MADKSKLQMSLDEVAKHYQVDSRPARRGRGSGIRKNAPVRANFSRGDDDVMMRDAGASGSGGAWYRGGGGRGGGRFRGRGRNDWNSGGGSPAWRQSGGSAWGWPERRGRGAYYGGGGGYSSIPPGCFVKVEGLEYSVMEQDLREAFETVGEVASVWVDYDQTDRSEGTGGAIFSFPEEARRAVSTFNGRLLDGKRLKLTVSATPPPRRGGGGGRSYGGGGRW